MLRDMHLCVFDVRLSFENRVHRVQHTECNVCPPYFPCINGYCPARYPVRPWLRFLGEYISKKNDEKRYEPQFTLSHCELWLLWSKSPAKLWVTDKGKRKSHQDQTNWMSHLRGNWIVKKSVHVYLKTQPVSSKFKTFILDPALNLEEVELISLDFHFPKFTVQIQAITFHSDSKGCGK